MKKHICIIIAAVLSLVSCGNAETSGDTAPETTAAEAVTSSADETPAETEHAAPSETMTYIVSDEDGFTSGQQVIELGSDGRFRSVYSKNGETLTYPGAYEASGTSLSLEYDRISTADELYAVSDIYRDCGDTDKMISFVNELLDSEPPLYTLRSGMATPVGGEHEYRKEAYKVIADSLFLYLQQLFLPEESVPYGIFSSEAGMNENIPDASAELLYKDIQLMDGMRLPELSLYTPEQGLTEELDMGEHEWLIVVIGSTVAAAGVGESFDSEVCGISTMWYFDSSGEPQVLEGEDAEAITTLSDLYEFYAK